MVLFTEATASPAVIAPKCEDLGFESLFIPEHQLVPPITRSYNHPNWQTLTGGEIPETFAQMPDQFVAAGLNEPNSRARWLPRARRNGRFANRPSWDTAWNQVP